MLTGTKALPQISPLRLPTETWRECWSYSEPRELRRLVRVNRLFRDICRPMLFRCLVYWPPFPEDITCRTWHSWLGAMLRSALRIGSLILEEEAAATRALVQEWEFHGTVELEDVELEDLPYQSFDGYNPFQETYYVTELMFVASLPEYSNLRSLTLSNIQINGRARGILSMLPLLNSLSLDDCNLVCWQGPLLRLQTFRILGKPWSTRNISGEDTSNENDDTDMGNDMIKLLSSEKLTHLVINDWKDAKLFLPALLALGSFNRLTNLSICVPKVAADTFFSFLRACPSIESLTIMDFSVLPLSFESALPRSVLPLLQSYAGPIHFARIFVPDHPVSTVDLSRGRRTDGAIGLVTVTAMLNNVVSRSTAAVHTLSLPTVPPGLDIFKTILHLFPQLKNLTMRVEDAPIPWVPLRCSDSRGGEEDVHADDEPESGEEEEEDDGYDFDVDCDSISSDYDEPSATPVPPPPSPPAQRRIAPIETDLCGLPKRKADSLAGMMDWLALGSVTDAQLPPLLEKLHIWQVHNTQFDDVRTFPLAEQRTVLIALAAAYPALREVGFLGYTSWRRCGKTWDEPRR